MFPARKHILTTAVLAGALLVPFGTLSAQAAPATATVGHAQLVVSAASSAKVDAVWRKFLPPQVFVNGKFGTVTVKPKNKKVITLENGEHAYTSYKVTIKLEDSGTVLYSDVLSTWRAGYAFTTLTSTGEMKPGYTGTKYTRAAIRQRMAYIEDEKVSVLRNQLLAYRAEVKAEHKVMKNLAPQLLQEFLSAWHWAGRLHTFAGLDYPKSGTIAGYPYKIVGNDPTTSQLRIYVDEESGLWVGIKNKGKSTQGYVVSYPGASKTAAIYGTFNDWLVNNKII
jgi:hypothetical protein